ncbi:MAG: hypothetical protein ACQESP_05630 [Candidatus Muiribacteriota bacterium]
MNFSYIKCFREVENIRAFFLTVNEKGVPVDFRYTEKIKIDKIKKFMFGSLLDKHFKTSVFIDKFLSSIDFEIDYFFVNDEGFLDNKTFENIIYIEETDEDPLEHAGSVQETSDNSYLIQPSFSGNPLKVKVKSREIIDKFSAIISDEDFQKESNDYYLYEPFIRLEKLHEVI